MIQIAHKGQQQDKFQKKSTFTEEVKEPEFSKEKKVSMLEHFTQQNDGESKRPSKLGQFPGRGKKKAGQGGQ